MEKTEISLHEVKVYLALCDKWLTNNELATKIDGVAPRTVRLHTHRLVQLGVADQAEVFPGHRYRLSTKADKRNGSYVIRLQKAVEVFGLAQG